MIPIFVIVLWLVYGIFVFTIAKICNVVFFRNKHASMLVALSLTAIVFLINIFAFALINEFLFTKFFDIIPETVAVEGDSLLLSIVFFCLLDRQKKSAKPEGALGVPMLKKTPRSQASDIVERLLSWVKTGR